MSLDPARLLFATVDQVRQHLAPPAGGITTVPSWCISRCPAWRPSNGESTSTGLVLLLVITRAWRRLTGSKRTRPSMSARPASKPARRVLTCSAGVHAVLCRLHAPRFRRSRPTLTTRVYTAHSLEMQAGRLDEALRRMPLHDPIRDRQCGYTLDKPTPALGYPVLPRDCASLHSPSPASLARCGRTGSLAATRSIHPGCATAPRLGGALQPSCDLPDGDEEPVILLSREAGVLLSIDR